MIELRALGSLELKGIDGRDLLSVLPQSKRLGLLAFLAVATPRGFHRRDTLLALFWPRLDEARARHALSQALHVWRRALGPGTIERHGNGGVGLNRERCWCDVDAFETALDRGEPAAALALYRGDLLEGLHVPDAPDFDRWLSSERLRLRARAVDAATRLAQQHETEGDLVAAVRWASRAIAVDPYNEGAVQRLIRVLDRSGDRSGAVRAYDEFVRRLSDELDLEPAPETRELAIRVREREAAAPDGVAGTDRMPAGPSVRVAGPDPGLPARPSRPPATPAKAMRQRSRLRAAPIPVALASALALGAAWLIQAGGAARERGRIAVLPFENIAPTAENDYLAAGLTEEIILRLAEIRGVNPIARTSVMRYANTSRNIREIGRELNAEMILEGTVRVAGDRVRVTAQLINAETGGHLWSELYERELTDIFEIQADIALRIAGSLKRRLSPEERTRIARRPTHDPVAYREYLRGRYLSWTAAPENAIEAFERAITLDPAYALAHAGLADLYSQLGVLGSLPPGLAFQDARAAAERALALDPELPEAHTALGAVRFWYEWDWDGAKRAYRRAFELGRTRHLDHFVAFLMARGREREAIPEARRRLELDPMSSTRHLALAWTYFMAGRHDEAIAQLEALRQLDPGFAWTHVELAWNYAFKGLHRKAVAEARAAEGLLGGPDEEQGTRDFAFASLAHVYALAGERTDALRILTRLQQVSRERYVDPFKFAVIHAGLGDIDAALESLERAFAVRSPQMVYLRPMARHFFARLRTDPRYIELLRAMRLDG